MGSFVVHRSGEGSYYVALISVNGDIILRGTNCEDLLACKNSVDSIRNHAANFSKYELMDSYDGKFFFELKGSDGKRIARSTNFKTPEHVFSGIELIRRNISTVIVDSELSSL